MSPPGSNAAPETGPFFPRDLAWHPPALTPRYKTTVLRSPPTTSGSPRSWEITATT